MNPVAKALWFIESHSAAEIRLEDIAGAAGVSRYHLCRVFGLATGLSVGAYLRGRRLTEAARQLADGAGDILAVALEAGYGSHEAFTRAFRAQFGLTPEQVRRTRGLDTLKLVEPIIMDDLKEVSLEPPRFVDGKPMFIAGLAERFGYDATEGIPALWQRFSPYMGHVQGEIPGVAYGLCTSTGEDDGRFLYIAGVEVSDLSGLPDEFTGVRLPAHRYAVFSHREHISGIKATVQTIWSTYLPEAGLEITGDVFERYGPEFDPETGTGLTEIWVPVKVQQMPGSNH